MENNNFERAFKDIILIEGGYVNDPLDRGGKTKYGITESVARSYGYQRDMKDLDISFAKFVYKKGYWDINWLDKVEDEKLQYEIFECGVNRGVRTPIKYAQQAYNALNGATILVEDGIMGKNTLEAINSYKHKDILFNAMNILQGNSYITIARKNPTQAKFLRGWLSKRVELIEK